MAKQFGCEIQWTFFLLQSVLCFVSVYRKIKSKCKHSIQTTVKYIPKHKMWWLQLELGISCECGNIHVLQKCLSNRHMHTMDNKHTVASYIQCWYTITVIAIGWYVCCICSMYQWKWNWTKAKRSEEAKWCNWIENCKIGQWKQTSFQPHDCRIEKKSIHTSNRMECCSAEK